MWLEEHLNNKEELAAWFFPTKSTANGGANFVKRPWQPDPVTELGYLNIRLPYRRWIQNCPRDCEDILKAP